MGGFSPWHGLVLLLLVAIPAAIVLALVWLVRRNRHDRSNAPLVGHRGPGMHSADIAPARTAGTLD